jgi:hypothetical protein
VFVLSLQGQTATEDRTAREALSAVEGGTAKSPSGLGEESKATSAVGRSAGVSGNDALFC